MFFLTFTVGDFLKGYFEQGLELFSGGALEFLQSAGVSPWLVSLIVDGIIAGVGGILTFLPNIFILFLALAFLEDSGYMARVAYVMNETMSMVGLSGKAFLPMLLGFGCTVPAVMATRALESHKDRLRTILVTPFMSCSARLPIYVLFAELFFPDSALLVAYSLYLIGVLMAILVSLVVHKTWKGTSENALLIELPEYKMPNLRTVAIYVWDKVKDYLTKAGTTIFPRLHRFVVRLKQRAVRICDRGFGKLCREIRTSSCAGVKAGRPGKLADRRGPDFRNFRQGGCGIQLFRPLRDQQHQFGRRHGRTYGSVIRFRLRPGKCLRTHDFLPALYAVHSNDCHHKKRNSLFKMDDRYGIIPISACMGGGGAGLPGRKPSLMPFLTGNAGMTAAVTTSATE